MPVTIARIPTELNAELLRRANAGETTQQLADWLTEEKQLRCSHVTVSRRLYALRVAEGAPPSASLQEVEKLLHANAVLLQDADESLAELEEVALHGDPERGLKPDMANAQKIAFKRAAMALAMQRLLFARLRFARDSARQAMRDASARRYQETLRRSLDRYVEADEAADEEVGADAPETIIREPVRVEPSPGRNAKCPCGSGLKYKKCCLERGNRAA